MFVVRKLAVVEFQHGVGCTTGEPYGECTRNCDYKTIKIVRHRLTEKEQQEYEVEPKQRKF